MIVNPSAQTFEKNVDEDIAREDVDGAWNRNAMPAPSGVRVVLSQLNKCQASEEAHGRFIMDPYP